MQVFKFGGASVKSADAVRNVAEIIGKYPAEKLLLVVSAMDKTTNRLEELTKAYFNGDAKASVIFQELKDYHFNILESLFPDKSHPVYTDINNQFVEIDWVLEEEPSRDFDYLYDQLVSVGELLSSRIVAHFLSHSGLKVKWMDARDVIKTSNTYREGKVDWVQTQNLAQKQIPTLFTNCDVILTQGFIGCTSENYTTTLGREGSDYSAAIFAYCLDATKLSIWKDVPGVLNADPKWFDKTEKLDHLSYQDAVELTYYGATVIHPKTIRPLQSKNIPLEVRSFVDFTKKGTIISKDSQTEPFIPCFIFKVNQVLITIYSKDFSFIVEEHLSRIFDIFARHRVKVNLVQQSAITLSLCVDKDDRRIVPLLNELKSEFDIRYNEDLELVTIRHYNQATLDRVTENKVILLEQKSRNTAQIVMKDK